MFKTAPTLAALNTPGAALNTPGAALNTPGAALNTPGAALNYLWQIEITSD